jgi:hypothetical protein
MVEGCWYWFYNTRDFTTSLNKMNNIPKRNKADIVGSYPSPCSGFFIVNRYDRPSEYHIAERRKDGHLYYVHPKLRKEKRYWAMNPDDPTPLEDFGIRIMIKGGKLHGKLVDPSRATYLDGRVRKWQGDDEFFFDCQNKTSPSVDATGNQIP